MFFQSTRINLADYTPVGDITVMSLSMIMCFLLWQTYVRKGKSVKKMFTLLINISTVALLHLIYEMMLYAQVVHPIPAHLFRLAYCIGLTTVLFFYIRYLHEPLWIPIKGQRRFSIETLIVLGITLISDVFCTIRGVGFRFDENGAFHYGFNCFEITYSLMLILSFYIIVKYRSRVIKQVFWGLIVSNMIAVTLLIVQQICDQVSYTTVAYFCPAIGLLFMFHSNPYDIETGAISGRYLEHEISDAMEKNTPMLLMSCMMVDFSKAIKTSNELKYEFYSFFRQNIKKGILYTFQDERFILTLRIRNRNDLEKLIDKMLSDFHKSYEKFKIDYKIVIAETDKLISDPADYSRLIASVEENMPFNNVHRVAQDDIKQFYDSSYIISQLEDIALHKDLNDPRVVVFCQPVFNISTGMYDTAEALMRLQLEKTGMVFPNQFISLAEQNNAIHALSMIILNKTCSAIRDFLEDGLELRRISVNFSTIDLRYENFCDEVKHIIERNGIPYDKIAVEITESRNDADFNLMKQRVEQLQKLGIKFYLDDFGTGYSNFERIMEIPFDIIKFDRSMLIETNNSAASLYMVSTFADMFNNLHYSVLFEGVEDDTDEKKCVGMNAKYLQGFKYSRPIPIAKLREFISILPESVSV